MIEIEAESMQGKAVEGIQGISVLLVACHGIAKILHVDANLVLSARLEPHLGQGISPARGYAPVVRDGLCRHYPRGCCR